MHILWKVSVSKNTYRVIALHAPNLLQKFCPKWPIYLGKVGQGHTWFNQVWSLVRYIFCVNLVKIREALFKIMRYMQALRTDKHTHLMTIPLWPEWPRGTNLDLDIYILNDEGMMDPGHVPDFLEGAIEWVGGTGILDLGGNSLAAKTGLQGIRTTWVIKDKFGSLLETPVVKSRTSFSLAANSVKPAEEAGLILFVARGKLVLPVTTWASSSYPNLSLI